MIQTTPLSQRDSRWKDVILGFGTGSIGNFGCTITSLTMLLNSKGANLTPLKENNLISLCRNCHIQTNFNRENWINYYKDKLKSL